MQRPLSDAPEHDDIPSSSNGSLVPDHPTDETIETNAAPIPLVSCDAAQAARYPKIVADGSHADRLIQKTLQAERRVDDEQSDGASVHGI